MLPHLKIVLSTGEDASVLESDGDKTMILATRAFPPGSTLTAQAATMDKPFSMKVSRSKRSTHGFEVEGRIRNASRELRDWLTRKGATANST